MVVMYGDAAGRWARFGPYYAMFPHSFAANVVRKHLPQGGALLDPFMGRGTSIFAAAAAGGTGIGFDISPVAWVYAATKLRPAPQWAVEDRLRRLVQSTARVDADALPEFFHHCFSRGVLEFLLRARAQLQWHRSTVDRTLMAFLLAYLHGKEGEGLSNQMRQAKAMAPDYSVAWWKSHGRTPPEIDVEPFLLQRIRWRYKHGVIDSGASAAYLGDCRQKLLPVRAQRDVRCDLLFTSPPYCGVTDYDYDQWLRLWLAGGAKRPKYSMLDRSGKLRSEKKYRKLLESSFSKASLFMKPNAVIYVRTDARNVTLDATIDALNAAFPKRKWSQINRPFHKETQTSLYGDKELKPGEVDLLSTAAQKVPLALPSPAASLLPWRRPAAV